MKRIFYLRCPKCNQKIITRTNQTDEYPRLMCWKCRKTFKLEDKHKLTQEEFSKSD